CHVQGVGAGTVLLSRGTRPVVHATVGADGPQDEKPDGPRPVAAGGLLGPLRMLAVRIVRTAQELLALVGTCPHLAFAHLALATLGAGLSSRAASGLAGAFARRPRPACAA